MLNTVYRLVEPRKFEAHFTDIDVLGDEVIVRPTHLSICNADQRYYQGKRAKEVLKQKLPMSLIHEAIGQIEYDPKNEFKIGSYVVMIPNTPQEHDDIIAENYLRSSNSELVDLTGLCRIMYQWIEIAWFRYLRKLISM